MKLLKECCIAGALMVMLLILFVVSTMTTSHAQSEIECSFCDQQGAEIQVQENDGKNYLFLPSSADLTSLTFKTAFSSKTDVILSGDSGSIAVKKDTVVDITALASEDENNEYQIQMTATRSDGSVQVKSFAVMQSAKIRSMYLTSEKASEDQHWVNSSTDHQASGSMVLLTAQGDTVYSGALSQIRVRGNTTANNEKKPYQIKLDNAADLLSTGDAGNENKTWVLIANYSDATLMQDKVIYDLAEEIGVRYTTQCDFVDLYYDGEYCGNYLLCEKVEVGSGRVDISDLGTETDAINTKQGDLDAVPAKVMTGADGSSIRYLSLLGEPEDITGGYLFEFEVPERYVKEQAGFTTSGGQQVVIKSPSHATQNEVTYISGLWQEFEDAVMNGGINPDTGKSYDEYVDVDSLARAYLINELTKNGDGFRTSCYFYKEKGDDKIYAGPVWDFDISCGVWYNQYEGYMQDPEGMLTGMLSLPYHLMQIDSFRETVNDIYQNELYPAVQNILMGDKNTQGETLHSIDYYAEELDASQQMNYRLWPMIRRTSSRVYPTWGGETYEGNVEYLSDFLTERSTWLSEELAKDTVDWEQAPDDVDFHLMFFTDYLTIHKNGWLENESDTEFGYNSVASWSDMITLMYCRSGDSVTYNGEFTNVTAEDSYADAAAWAKQKGIETGRSFNANAMVTKEELAKVLYELAGEPESKYDALSNSPDADSVGEGYEDACNWALSTGVLQQTRSTRAFGPQDIVTRGVGCQMIMNTWRVIEGAD